MISMNGIEMVDVFIFNYWSEQYFKYLKVGEIFKMHRNNDRIKDENIWIVVSSPYKNKDDILTIDCEEFKGELDETSLLNWITDDIKKLNDRINVLENKNKEEKVVVFKNECVLPNSAIEKLTDNIKITEEVQLKECITPNNYTFNINIENIKNEDKESLDKFFKTINDNMQKLGIK